MPRFNTETCFCGGRMWEDYSTSIWECSKCGFSFNVLDITMESSSDILRTIRKAYVEYRDRKSDPMNVLPQKYKEI